jgi:hypothetical protein
MVHAQRKNGAHTEFPDMGTTHMQAMMECMSICEACAKMCLDEGHKKTAQLCVECADICAMAIKSSNFHSEFQPQIMDLCVQVCQRCAEECKKMKAKHCQECAEVCTTCADACSNVSV